jgi:putative endonuclease
VLAWLSGLGRRSAPRTDKALGRAGERAAARLLRRAGYAILGRNVRLRIGEADLVCLAPDRQTLVVVEVKTRRRGAEFSIQGEVIPPEASVHQRKRKKLVAVTRALVRANGWEGRQLRIDVVAVEWPDAGGAPTLRHHENAVTC